MSWIQLFSKQEGLRERSGGICFIYLFFWHLLGSKTSGGINLKLGSLVSEPSQNRRKLIQYLQGKLWMFMFTSFAVQLSFLSSGSKELFCQGMDLIRDTPGSAARASQIHFASFLEFCDLSEEGRGTRQTLFSVQFLLPHPLPQRTGNPARCGVPGILCNAYITSNSLELEVQRRESGLSGHLLPPVVKLPLLHVLLMPFFLDVFPQSLALTSCNHVHVHCTSEAGAHPQGKFTFSCRVPVCSIVEIESDLKLLVLLTRLRSAEMLPLSFWFIFYPGLPFPSRQSCSHSGGGSLRPGLILASEFSAFETSTPLLSLCLSLPSASCFLYQAFLCVLLLAFLFLLLPLLSSSQNIMNVKQGSCDTNQSSLLYQFTW